MSDNNKPLNSSIASSLDKHFDHNAREQELYKLWLDSGTFKPESAQDQNSEVFNIAMPPPNANGELHLGHAFGYTVMDILGRFHRLCGKRVLLLPGKDHAGIQTQVVYEKLLQKQGVDYKNTDLKKLYDDCYAFCIDRANYMRTQEYRIGISADWDREFFTLDPKLNEIIFETFTRMWNDGLIYKGNRITNWSVFSQTAISDVEVEYKEVDAELYFIRYPFVENFQVKDSEFLSGQGLMTATTRPETMLGDTAFAVHPEDERYKDIIGRKVKIPLCGREISIIGDKRVDPKFGTGVIKVTPAHSFVDYEIGQEHKLELIQIIGKDGKMTLQAGQNYQGLKIEECRTKVVADLDAQGFLLKVEKFKHNVPIGERGKDIIEPMLSDQWFVNVDKEGNSLKKRALQFIKEGKIKIHPERFQVLFEQWLENLRDWNISRQIWWGHQMPVWYREQNGKTETYVGAKAPLETGWTQEKDTFDTWFSSGQWAYSTFAAAGLCDIDEVNKRPPYVPSHTMVMGRDILFFWACRMLLLTTYRLNDVPWKNIFFTGLIRDEHGQKMSKSKGNGIEPNDVISKHGADSLRLAMVVGASPGNDLNLSEKKFEGYGKFINKLWNAAKLLEMKLADGEIEKVEIKLASSSWILSELAKVKANVTDKLNRYEISIAADELYSFTWTVFCDWYLEMFKTLAESQNSDYSKETKYVAQVCFSEIITMLHPFIPFVTEELYQKLSFLQKKESQCLAGAAWDTKLPSSLASESGIPELQQIITAVRSVKAALNIPHKTIRANLDKDLSLEMKTLLGGLARVELCDLSKLEQEKILRKPYGTGVICCEVEGKENYKLRLEKDLAATSAQIKILESKLAGDFAMQAKPELVELEREKLRQAHDTMLALQSEITGI